MKRAYRKFLYSILCVGLLALVVTTYFALWSKVPSTILLKAGEEQILDLQVPASGEVYRETMAMSGQSDAKEVRESVYLDLAKPLKIKVNEIDQYTVNLKLFGIIPLKSVDIEVIQEQMLTPAGIPIGIYVKTEGVLVVGIGEFTGEDGMQYAPARYVLKTGDYILELNDEKIIDKAELIDKIDHSEGQEMILKVQRGEETIQLKAQPALNQNGEYKLGIWIRDNAQGVGTMTYVDDNNCFGALGHGINDVDTSDLMTLNSGTLYQTEIVGITKGSNGLPGELAGYIEYDENHMLGSITNNTVKGIFGVCNETARASITSEPMPIGLKQEIETGPAEIICSLGDEPQSYTIEITDVQLENDNVNRGIVLKITDKRLLNTTGGIVQGMSGSPIIQNGKLIGAVTHVLVQDASCGYGIFIEQMLEH